jgi:hypothetical protein
MNFKSTVTNFLVTAKHFRGYLNFPIPTQAFAFRLYKMVR